MEFCPVCLLRKGLGGGVASGKSSVSEETVEPATLKEPARRFEHYELVTGEDGKPVELGRGAMGVTSARLRFLREARAAASVRHTNVASVFHLGRTGENSLNAQARLR
jgi:hypothetical protein